MKQVTYRKHSKFNSRTYVKLNDNGTMKMVYIEDITYRAKGNIGYSKKASDWDMAYNEYQHSNAREFNDAYNLVKENI